MTVLEVVDELKLNLESLQAAHDGDYCVALSRILEARHTLDALNIEVRALLVREAVRCGAEYYFVEQPFDLPAIAGLELAE